MQCRAWQADLRLDLAFAPQRTAIPDLDEAWFGAVDVGVPWYERGGHRTFKRRSGVEEKGDGLAKEGATASEKALPGSTDRTKITSEKVEGKCRSRSLPPLFRIFLHLPCRFLWRELRRRRRRKKAGCRVSLRWRLRCFLGLGIQPPWPLLRMLRPTFGDDVARSSAVRTRDFRLERQVPLLALAIRSLSGGLALTLAPTCVVADCKELRVATGE